MIRINLLGCAQERGIRQEELDLNSHFLDVGFIHGLGYAVEVWRRSLSTKERTQEDIRKWLAGKGFVHLSTEDGFEWLLKEYPPDL